MVCVRGPHFKAERTGAREACTRGKRRNSTEEQLCVSIIRAISYFNNHNYRGILCQSVNFGRHLTKIRYPFEISYQIFIHTLPYQYLSFRNFTLPKFFFEKSYLTKIFFLEMLRIFTIIKVSVNRLYVNVTLRWVVDVN